MIVKCAPQTEWPAETNVETHWSWDLRTETLESLGLHPQAMLFVHEIDDDDDDDDDA